MFEKRTVAVVVPCYNEEGKIGKTLESMPQYIDAIYVVDDCSTDDSRQVIESCAQQDSRIRLIAHPNNRGVGASIATGYGEVIKTGEDYAIVMAGDGQMSPDDLPALLRPMVDGVADYAKGNRFFHRIGTSQMPFLRLFGNVILSSLTKIVSGYWHVSDTQCGYTVINKEFLNYVDWGEVYPRYGCPNDILTRLNIVSARVAEVPVQAVYGPSWGSKMRVRKIMMPILRLLFSLFLTRMYRKHVYLDGHPLILCYGVGFLCLLGMLISFVMLISSILMPQGSILAPLILFSLFSIIATQMFLSAFSMDYEENKRLYIKLPHKMSRKFGQKNA